MAKNDFKKNNDGKNKSVPKAVEIEKKQIEETVTIPTVSQQIEKPTKKSKKKSIILWIILLLVLTWLVFIASRQKVEAPFDSNLKTEKDDKGIVKAWDKIKVDYVWRLADWTIFDSSLEEFAKQIKNYNPESGRKYEPLEFTVWAWQMIKWFDEWVVWMKVWEKKELRIEPKDAYWDASITQTVPEKYLSDTITQDVPAESFQDKLRKSVPIQALWMDAGSIKVWQEIDAWWVIWKVAEIKGSEVVLEIDNASNPFKWKTLAVWLQADYQWNTITIKNITPETITVEVDNKQNPFYWKKLAVWLIWKLPNGQDVTIDKIENAEVTISTKNTHELAWKTLMFDVELKEIEK